MARPHLSHEARQRLKEAQLARCRNPRLAEVIERNIGTILQVREEFEQSKSRQDRAADGITAFSGSMLFVYLHVLWFSLWIIGKIEPRNKPSTTSESRRRGRLRATGKIDMIGTPSYNHFEVARVAKRTRSHLVATTQQLLAWRMRPVYAAKVHQAQHGSIAA